MTLFMTPALARTAYVGVASVGADRGVLGHVFLVFAPEPGRFFDAVFYQYAIQVPAGFRLDRDGVRALSHYPFAVETGPAWALIKKYVGDNRGVLLFELDLDDARARDLEARAERERERRRAVPQNDFSLDENCATRTYDLINQVAGARPIRYARPRALGNPLVPRDRVALAIPVLAAPRLAVHPLVKSRATFRPGNVVAVEVALSATTEVEPLYRACGVSADARELMTRVYAAPNLRRRYLEAFRKLFATCALTPELTALYDGHLDFLGLDQRDAEFTARLNAAYR